MNEDIDDLLERCENLYDEGRYEEIVAICDEILEKDMNSEIALGHKANALGFLERDDEALECSNLGIELHPKNHRFYLFKAEILYWVSNDLDGAIECYEKGLSLAGDIDKYWYPAKELVMALFQKAELLEKSESFKEAVGIYEKILFYRPDEFNALDAIDSLVAGHGLDYEPSPQYVQSLDLRKRARKRAEKIDDCLDSVEIGEYDDDYVRGCSKFKDYKSIDEYIRDLIICLMERYPGRSEEMSRHLVKVSMDYVRSSYEHGEPADYCSIEVGYCCG